MKNLDNLFMTRAIKLAKRAFGQTSPNPLVGAVIVKNNNIIGEGWHKKAGTPHAEINAISDAGIENCEGASIYVTLEPCSSSGRTPPCTEAIKAAKFAKVIIGSTDPNPKHAGKAIEIFKNAEILTLLGIETQKCLDLNEAFFHWIQTGSPFVLLKMAMTLDGKIATVDGNSKWITGPIARKRVQYLRKWADAIMVGGKTALKDFPSLNVRSTTNPDCELRNWRQPERIIASHSLTGKEANNLLKPGKQAIIFQAETKEEYQNQLKKLGAKNITALLIEGGGELAGSLLQANVVQKVEFHIAGKILGGRDSRPVIAGANPFSLADAYNLKNLQIKKLGNDISISGLL